MNRKRSIFFFSSSIFPFNCPKDQTTVVKRLNEKYNIKHSVTRRIRAKNKIKIKVSSDEYYRTEFMLRLRNERIGSERHFHILFIHFNRHARHIIYQFVSLYGKYIDHVNYISYHIFLHSVSNDFYVFYNIYNTKLTFVFVFFFSSIHILLLHIYLVSVINII